MHLPYDVLSQPPSIVYNMDEYGKKNRQMFFTRINSQVRNKLQASRPEMTSQ